MNRLFQLRERKFLHTLTPDQRIATIVRLALHSSVLQDENDELTDELEATKDELAMTLAARPKAFTLRDQRLADQIAAGLAKRVAEQAQETPSKPPTPPLPVAPSPPLNQPALPAPSSPTVIAAATEPSAAEAPAHVPAWRQLLNRVGGFSPFASRANRVRKSQPTVLSPRLAQQEENDEQHEQEQQSTLSPLGELPPTRKRSAATEVDPTPSKRRFKTPQQTYAEVGLPASTLLDTISERTEPPSASTVVPTTTPSRPRKRMAPPEPERTAPTRVFPEPEPPEYTGRTEKAPTPRPRTIKEVRAAREARAALAVANSAPPLHRWQTPQKPREPNADKRLARMQILEHLKKQREKMEEEINRLSAEQEADGIDTRKMKRVKVDNLVYIPHNQPGDAAGTFRVPDWDSDDEMDVLEDVPERPNVFTVNAEVPTQEQSALENPQTREQSELEDPWTPESQAAQMGQILQEHQAPQMPQPTQVSQMAQAEQAPEMPQTFQSTQPPQASQGPPTTLMPPPPRPQQSTEVDAAAATNSPEKPVFQWPNVNSPPPTTSSPDKPAFQWPNVNSPPPAATSSPKKSQRPSLQWPNIGFPPLEAQPSARRPAPPPARPRSSTPQPPTSVAQVGASAAGEKAKFEWPSVGLRPADDEEWSEERKAAAGAKFAVGYDHWRKTGLLL